jgi:hypothetical protein
MYMGEREITILRTRFSWLSFRLWKVELGDDRQLGLEW